VSFRIDIGGKVLTNHLKEVISYRSVYFPLFLSFIEVVFCVFFLSSKAVTMFLVVHSLCLSFHSFVHLFVQIDIVTMISHEWLEQSR